MRSLDIFLYLAAVALFVAAAVIAWTENAKWAAIVSLGLVAAFLVPLIALIQA